MTGLGKRSFASLKTGARLFCKMGATQLRFHRAKISELRQNREEGTEVPNSSVLTTKTQTDGADFSCQQMIVPSPEKSCVVTALQHTFVLVELLFL